MMNAAEYVIFLKQSLDLSEQGWKMWREDLESWQQQRSEQFNDPSFQYRYSLEESPIQGSAMPENLGDWLSDTFNQIVVQPLKDALPSSVRSKVADVPVLLLQIRALNGHALKAPNGEPVIVINQGLLNIAQFYKEMWPAFGTLYKSFGEEVATAYMIRSYKFLIDRYLHPDIPFPEELIKMPENMAATSMAWTVGMETFVVAHELAHIYANHLDQANAKMLSI